MTKEQNRQFSCGVYMGALAVSNTVTLILIGGSSYLIGLLEIKDISSFTCLTLTYILYAMNMIGLMVILALNYDRFIAVWYTFKFSAFCTAARTKVIICTICFSCIFSFIFNIPHIFTTNKQHICQGYATETLATHIFSWISIGIYSVIPFLFILVTNSVIIYSHRQLFSSYQINDTGSVKKVSEVGQV